MVKTAPSIAATSTLAMVCTAEARGVATADLLADAGLSRAYLEDPDARMAAPTVIALWDALRERTGDPELQLVAPVSLPFGAYRVIDYLVRASTTVGEGVGRFVQFFHLITQSATLRIESDENELRLCLTGAEGGAVPAVYVDYVFAALVSRMRMRVRAGLRVRRVELRRVEPAARARYEEVFAAPVHFGCGRDVLCFSREEWAAPTDGADTALALLLEQHAQILAQRLPRSTSVFRSNVEQALAGACAEGGSAERVARALNVSVRTLQRKLIATGTTFRKLSEAVRGQLAVGYLADPAVSIAEVALLLGFSDQSSFNRAFRRWTGESPGRWRRRRTTTAPIDGLA